MLSLSLLRVRSASVVIGAPKANTTQANITEGGSVFYCPWSRTQADCHAIEFDTEGEFDGDTSQTGFIFSPLVWDGGRQDICKLLL